MLSRSAKLKISSVVKSILHQLLTYSRNIKLSLYECSSFCTSVEIDGSLILSNRNNYNYAVVNIIIWVVGKSKIEIYSKYVQNGDVEKLKIRTYVKTKVCKLDSLIDHAVLTILRSILPFVTTYIEIANMEKLKM